MGSRTEDTSKRTGLDARATPGRRGRRLARLLAAAALAGLLALPSAAGGHAVPIAMTPGENAVLPDPPGEVVLRFSERVEGRASSLTVLDAHGRQVDRGDATVDRSDPWRYRVTLPPLAAGPYTVAWRVLSADDGHFTEGAHVFAVRHALGLAPPASRPLLGADRWARAAARGAATLGATALLGLVAGPLILGTSRAAGRAGPVLAAAGLVLAGGGLELGLGAREVAGGGPFWPALGTLLTTPVGHVATTRTGLVVALVALLLGPARAPTHRASGRWIVALGLAAAVVVAPAPVSHAAARADVGALAIGIEALHVLATALWLGALVAFAWVAWPLPGPSAQDDAARLARLISALSSTAVVAVGTLTASGLFLARLQLDTLVETWSTPYGRWLLGKLALFAGMLALGGWHQWVVQRRLVRLASSGHPGAPIRARFSRTLRLEAALGVVALLVAAVLGSTPPPAAGAGAGAPGYRHERQLADVRVVLEITPARPGRNTVRVDVTDAAGRPLADATSAIVQLTPHRHGPGQGVGPVTLTPERRGPGVFVTTAAVLGLVGAWEGRLVVQRDGAYDANDRFELILTESGGAPAGALARAAPLDRLTAWSTAGIALATLGLWAAGQPTRRATRRLARSHALTDHPHAPGGSA